MPSIAFVGVPAAYRRGLASLADERGWTLSEESAADVTVTPLRSPADCTAIDALPGSGTVVLALVAPLGRDEIAHALRHGAFPTDWDDDPEAILAAADAALHGRLLVPAATARLLAPLAGECGTDPVISQEEVGWLVALSRGTTVVRLADDAGFSERAMFRRLADLYSRLGVRGRTEALLAAERLGLLGNSG